MNEELLNDVVSNEAPKLSKRVFAGAVRGHNTLAQCCFYSGVFFTRAHRFRVDAKQVRQVQNLTPS